MCGYDNQDGGMLTENKDTNPKDAVATNKVAMGLSTPVGMIYRALAFTEGLLKYGAWNWRIKGIRNSVYFFAALRHLWKWFCGQKSDLHTLVPHLASASACIELLIEGECTGFAVDDRPPKVDEALDKTFAEAERVTAHLRETFKDCHPKQYTIEDNHE
jgi:hypothetical protein